MKCLTSGNNDSDIKCDNVFHSDVKTSLNQNFSDDVEEVREEIPRYIYMIDDMICSTDLSGSEMNFRMLQ